jgi:hypothetical protein
MTLQISFASDSGEMRENVRKLSLKIDLTLLLSLSFYIMIETKTIVLKIHRLSLTFSPQFARK